MTVTALANAHPELASLAQRLTDEDIARAEAAEVLYRFASVILDEASRQSEPLMKAHDDETEQHYLEYLLDEGAPSWSDEAVMALLKNTIYGRISDIGLDIAKKVERFTR